MSPTRRDALRQLSALFALPLIGEREYLFGAVSDPLLGTIAEFQAGRVRGEYTATEITTRALERSRTLGQTLRAIDGMSTRALADARASDARLRARALRGPLDGVPLFAKSIYDVQGMPTTASSKAWAALYPDVALRDATEVQRLRNAGAVVMGKTAADDFAYRGNGTSSFTGQVLNPYDPSGTRTPGGSSAGSAVVVACGMAFGALGTDDGGSNRIPAQFTGVVGMKPTFGLVPRSGVIPTWPYLDTHGPLTRHVADAALMLDVLAGADGRDGLALQQPNTRGALRALRHDALVGARLGLVDVHMPRAQMTAECIGVLDRAYADCAAAGAIVESCTPQVTRVTYRDQFLEAATARGDVAPNPNAPAATANALWRYFGAASGNASGNTSASARVQRGHDAYRAFYDVLPAEWERMAALLSQPYEADAASVSFARSRRSVVALLTHTFRAQQLDALVYPTMPFSAPLAVDKWPDVRTPLGYGNWLGLPEVSVPAGYGADGMPAGNLSFVGLPGSDAKLLALAHAYEQHSRRFVAPVIR